MYLFSLTVFADEKGPHYTKASAWLSEMRDPGLFAEKGRFRGRALLEEEKKNRVGLSTESSLIGKKEN